MKHDEEQISSRFVHRRVMPNFIMLNIALLVSMEKDRTLKIRLLLYHLLNVHCVASER